MKSNNSLQVSCIQLHWARPLEENLRKTLDYIKRAANCGSRVVVFPETNLTGYYFPEAKKLKPDVIQQSLDETCNVAAKHGIWTICGSLRPTENKLLNIAHVISPTGDVVHEYAKVHMAGRDEKKYCRGGTKLSLFEIDGILCTLIICRDGRHPELYRIPGMAGAQIVFQPSCSSDEIEKVAWKRVSGRAQQPIGPNSKMFHCVANTIGESPDGKQTSSGHSFIREPSGIPLVEAGFHQEEMITAVLDMSRASRSYLRDSFESPPFLKKYWEQMIEEVKAHRNDPPL